VPSSIKIHSVSGSFDGLRSLLVASHCSLCSLANKLRLLVNTEMMRNAKWRLTDGRTEGRTTDGRRENTMFLAASCWRQRH